MAVLPTPGSPISTGLFFVRRLRICMTRWISWLRPMTGSSLLALAAAVRSMPSWSRVGVRVARAPWPVAVGEVWLSSRWVSARTLSKVTPRLSSTPGRHTFSFPQEPNEQMFGANIGVVHAAGLIHRQLHHLLGPGREADLSLRGSLAPADDKLNGGAHLIQVYAQIGEHTGCYFPRSLLRDPEGYAPSRCSCG